jgi:glycosyltransferase involved in cell wall biosynthesis
MGDASGGGRSTIVTQAAVEVAFVLPDKMGGVFNYVANLLAHRRPDGLSYAAIRTDNACDVDTRSAEPLPADRTVRFAYSLPPENVHSVLRRLARAIPSGPGAIVSNDWLELALTSIYDTGRAVIMVNHGDFDYYYDLAVRHRETVDAYVSYSARMVSRLRELLPDRAESIFLLPYGVDIPRETRHSAPGSLRLLYVGRLSRAKGVFDLPLIDRRLRDICVDVTWTIQGTGPDDAALRAAWSDRTDIRWTGMRPMSEVLALYQSHDVLVMPSRNEGLPVALLEAGAAGVVPVISNLASGIPEVVTPRVTGFRPEIGDIGGFADAISHLAADRHALEAMSAAIRDHVAAAFDADRCTAEYQHLFARWRELRRPRPLAPKLQYGSRLDQPWMPNSVVKAVRAITRRRRWNT